MSKYLILVLLSIVLLASLAACTVTYTKGSGEIVRQERAADGFKHISLEGSGVVYVTQGDSEGLTVEADDNLMTCIKTEVRGDTLYLGYDYAALRIIDPSQPVRFYVNMKDIAGLKISGAGRIEAEQVQADTLKLVVGGSGKMELGQIKAQKVEADISGSGSLDIANLEADTLSTDISGSGKLVLSGQVQEQSIHISGSGNYQAKDLSSDLAHVSISGSGNVELAVTQNLDITISGSGRVVYSGQPAITQSVSGSGKVIHRETN